MRKMFSKDKKKEASVGKKKPSLLYRIVSLPFRKYKLIINNIKRHILAIKKAILKSIRLQLVITALVSLYVSAMIGLVMNNQLDQNRLYLNNDSVKEIEQRLRTVTASIEQIGNSVGIEAGMKSIRTIIENESKYNDSNIYIIDLQGSLILSAEKSKNLRTDQAAIITAAMSSKLEGHNYMQMQTNYFVYNEAISVSRIGFEDGSGIYVAMSNMAKSIGNSPDGIRRNYYFAIITAVVVFILLMFLLTRKKIESIQDISFGLSEISQGKLDYRIMEKSQDELGILAQSINSMTEKLKSKSEDEKKANKVKNDLITNMSHDLRTPLTSLIGHLKMIQDKKFENEDKLFEYIDVACNKVDNLKELIDDLFFYSKLSNHDEMFFKEQVCLSQLLGQLLEELVPLCEENNVCIVKLFKSNETMVNVDAEKMVRVFENLLSNAIKFCFKPSEIKVSIEEANNKITVCIENQGENIPRSELTSIFDRLYRAKNTKNSSVEGSGLGLAIAKSIVQLQDGEIWAECEGNHIRFYVQLNIQPDIHGI